MLRFSKIGRLRSFVAVILIQLFSETTARSCEGRCGERATSCSCQPTCEALLECCEDFKQFCVEISPHSGSLLGGTDFRIVDVLFDRKVNLTCRFKSETVTQGYVDTDGVGHCVSPMLFESGWVPFDVSTDGVSYSRSGRWLSVHHSKLAEAARLTLVNETQWQYYGTQDVGGALEMAWDASLINAQRVNVELWGYNETGEPYSERWRAEWTYLYSVSRDVPNSGRFRFVPQLPSAPLSAWDVGSVRVGPSTEPDGARNVNALWSDGHALAYNLDEVFRRDPAAWALGRCLQWDQEEKHLPRFLSEITDCPCTLAQARADTGRFHTDYGCDIEKGSVCTYHPGAVHCVRAIQASPEYGAGQQCCYDHTGAQVLTGDSIGGSTPDRGHDWGSPPYIKPPRVPGFSHWKYDVITFYYCCLWSDNCHYYFSHRPSSGCRAYQPPKSASVLGDPHFITFDGVTYTFNGKGEYVLLHSSNHELTVQGRTEPMKSGNGSVIMATRLSSVAMRENGSDVIEVRLSDWPDHLQVLLNQKVLSFSEQSWIDLKGVEARARGGVMTLTVLLPHAFKHHTQGLLGTMNDDPDDDLTSSDGELTAANSTAQDIFAYGAQWAITNETSLFTYDSEFLLNEYFFAPKHDPTFTPNFSVSEDPSDPLLQPTLKMCAGVWVAFCKYDTLSTRSLEMGNNTLLSLRNHANTVRDLQPVMSCGWLQPPSHGQKEGTLYLEGATVSFSCNPGYHLYGPQQRTCHSDGQWSGSETYCLSDDSLGIVLGTVGAVLAMVAMVVAIVVYNKKQKREKMKESEDRNTASVQLNVAIP
ncbi:sushi domain-containing protein 2 isoform X2 [Brachyhypopomus gauderio]|uniref:sushi domain-containing protein 2 isoform X2 n=1 Tax=Brachyhypopomus gauderio TaxID=698409 RepID=UPI0040427746